MPFKFNPFSGNFDQTGSGGGGASYIDGEVATYNDLPLDGTAAINSAWLVREASGTWLLGRKPAGIYIRTATAGVSRDADYTYAGILPDVFSDANFTLYDDADSTKNAKFQLSGITTGTTRTLSVPDASGTIALLSNFLSATKDMIVLAPAADMSVTSSTTLADISGMSFTVAANTSYLCVCAWQLDCGAGGFQMVLEAPSVFAGGSSLAGYGFFITGSGAAGSIAQAGSTEIRAGNRGAAQVGPTFAIFAWRTDSTGGTAKFRFAQNGSNAAASVLKAQSRVLVIPIAS